jgi:GNAT superfamily N-acetyltransferase
MDEIVLRPARPGDGDDLARGWIETGRYYAALDPQAYQLPEPDGLAAWFETLLGKPSSEERIWLVAEVDGRVVGNVEARLERPVDSAPRQLLRHLSERRVVVGAIGVEERYRRRGVATRLMQAVEGGRGSRAPPSSRWRPTSPARCRCRSMSVGWPIRSERSSSRSNFVNESCVWR